MKIEMELNLGLLLRWMLGLILLWAAVSKLANLQDFYAALLGYQLPLPAGFLRGVAVALPWLELLCGLAFLGNVWREAALFWSMLLFVGFTLATGQAWARGLEISCGCLDLGLLGLKGGNGQASSIAKIFESVAFAFFRALLLTAVAGYLWKNGPGFHWAARRKSA